MQVPGRELRGDVEDDRKRDDFAFGRVLLTGAVDAARVAADQLIVSGGFQVGSR
jgi:hypothetical protein